MRKFFSCVGALVPLLLISCEGDSPETLAEAEARAAAPMNVYERVCLACHGPTGEGRADLQSPSIAGLPDWYVMEQLAKFREGKRGAHPEDTPGQVMRAIAMSLSDPDMKSAAALVAKMPEHRTEPPPAGFDPTAGRYHFANECMECHRYNGRGEIVFKSAQLVTLNRDYLRRQLQNFRDGRRGAENGDISGAKMVAMAGRLDDASIEMLVNYIGALANGDDPRGAREK